MQIRIFSIGKIRADYVQAGEAEYLKRMGSSGWKIERIEVDAETASGNNQGPAQKREAERLLSRVKDDELLIVLDERGRQLSSQGLADWLETRVNAGQKSVAFAIGGAFGWHADIERRADFTLSLSQLTFPYQLTRLILVEQLYRAHTIIQRLPYHKS